MEKINIAAGIVSEKELDAMLTEDTTVGAASTLPCAIAVATVALTFGWDFCPSNACTDSCRF